MGLVDRVKNILLSPRTEWEVIDAEPATVSGSVQGVHHPAGRDRADRAGHWILGLRLHGPVPGHLPDADRLGDHRGDGDLRADAWWASTCSR